MNGNTEHPRWNSWMNSCTNRKECDGLEIEAHKSNTPSETNQAKNQVT